MNYTQTSPISVDRSYVEVTGEGSEEFVLAIKNKWEMKQMESISLKKNKLKHLIYFLNLFLSNYSK